MVINHFFEKKIINFLGENGRKWLQSIPETIVYCSKKWQLKNLELCQLSLNYVLRGQSEIFGSVVLKICLPGHEYHYEKYALTHLNGDVMCECYSYDDRHQVLLLKACRPGYDLWFEKDIQKRLIIVAPLIKSTPRLLNQQNINDGDVFPTHKSWIDKISLYLQGQLNKDHVMLNHLNVVKEYYDHLDVKNNPIMLLHGDLHHGNILRDHKWTVIDPKGVTGYVSLEVGRYMNNQIQEIGIDKTAVLNDMLYHFSQEFNLHKNIILLSFYIDMVLSTAWSYEDVSPDFNNIQLKLEICHWLLKKIRGSDENNNE